MLDDQPNIPRLLKYWVNSFPSEYCVLVNNWDDLKNGNCIRDIILNVLKKSQLPYHILANKNQATSSSSVVRSAICFLADHVGWNMLPDAIRDSSAANLITEGDREICLTLLKYLYKLDLSGVFRETNDENTTDGQEEIEFIERDIDNLSVKTKNITQPKKKPIEVIKQPISIKTKHLPMKTKQPILKSILKVKTVPNKSNSTVSGPRAPSTSPRNLSPSPQVPNTVMIHRHQSMTMDGRKSSELPPPRPSIHEPFHNKVSTNSHVKTIPPAKKVFIIMWIQYHLGLSVQTHLTSRHPQSIRDLGSSIQSAKDSQDISKIISMHRRSRLGIPTKDEGDVIIRPTVRSYLGKWLDVINAWLEPSQRKQIQQNDSQNQNLRKSTKNLKNLIAMEENHPWDSVVSLQSLWDHMDRFEMKQKEQVTSEQILLDPWMNGVLLSQVVAAVSLATQRSLIKQEEEHDPHGLLVSTAPRLYLVGTHTIIKSQAQAIHNISLCMKVLQSLPKVSPMEYTAEDIFHHRYLNANMWYLMKVVYSHYGSTRLVIESMRKKSSMEQRTVLKGGKERAVSAPIVHRNDYEEKDSVSYILAMQSTLNRHHRSSSSDKRNDASNDSSKEVKTAVQSNQLKKIPSPQKIIPSSGNSQSNLRSSSVMKHIQEPSEEKIQSRGGSTLPTRFIPREKVLNAADIRNIEKNRERELVRIRDKTIRRRQSEPLGPDLTVINNSRYSSEDPLRYNNQQSSVEEKHHPDYFIPKPSRIEEKFPQTSHQLGLKNSSRFNPHHKKLLEKDWMPPKLEAEDDPSSINQEPIQESQLVMNSLLLPNITYAQMAVTKTWLQQFGISVLDGEAGFYQKDFPYAEGSSVMVPFSDPMLTKRSPIHRKGPKSKTFDRIDSDTGVVGVPSPLPLFQDRIRNGVLLGELILRLEPHAAMHANLKEVINHAPNTIQTCLNNIEKSLWLLQIKKSPPIPLQYLSRPSEILKGNKNLIWGLLYEIMQAYSNGVKDGWNPTANRHPVQDLQTVGYLDQPYPKNNAYYEALRDSDQLPTRGSIPSDSHKGSKLDLIRSQKLIHWLEHYGIFKYLLGNLPIPSSILSLESFIKDGTLLCLLTAKVFRLSAKNQMNWNKNPHTYSQCVKNVSKCLAVWNQFEFKTFSFYPGIEEEIVRGNWEVILDLLDNMMKWLVDRGLYQPTSPQLQDQISEERRSKETSRLTNRVSLDSLRYQESADEMDLESMNLLNALPYYPVSRSKYGEDVHHSVDIVPNRIKVSLSRTTFDGKNIG